MNMVSTIGALLMGVATIILLDNIVITMRKPKDAAADAWEDGRTLEWAMPSPPPGLTSSKHRLFVVWMLGGWRREPGMKR